MATPPPGISKINVDADATTSKTSTGGAITAMCRSNSGAFLGASTLTVNGGLSPAALEALACREALALAHDLSINRLCIASDCLEVINNLSRPYSGDYSMVVSEIKMTTSLFEKTVFRHERRSSDGEAHRLARSSMSQGTGRRLWLLNPPADLRIPKDIINN